jgi:hypothetical protein
MEPIDSKERKLPVQEIIAKYAIGAHTEELPAQTILACFVKEASLPNTSVKSYGNTVFITHFDKTKTKAVGRALNVDVGRNFVDNGKEYFIDLYKSGVRRFSTWFSEPSFAMAFGIFKRYPITTEMDVQIVKGNNGEFGVLIKLDGKLTLEASRWTAL